MGRSQAPAAASQKTPEKARSSALDASGQRMAQIWAELLGLEVTDIAAQDNFFDLGGSSLLAMRAIEETRRRLGVEIEPRRYAVESLAQLAQFPQAAGERPPVAITGAMAAVAGLWADLLGLEAGSIQAADNFFDLGGGSLQAMQFIDQAQRKLGLRFDPQRLVMATLGQLMEDAAPAAAAPVEPAAASRESGGLLSRVLRKAGLGGGDR